MVTTTDKLRQLRREIHEAVASGTGPEWDEAKRLVQTACHGIGYDPYQEFPSDP